MVFYIMQRDIPNGLRRSIEESVQKVRPEARVLWLDIPFDKLKDLKISHDYLSAAIYARLLVQWVIPPDVDKVLYLDSDVVVLEDLAELWDSDVEEKTVLAVQDRTGWVSSRGGLSNYRELGIPADSKYFNSGVLLINLKKWRERNRSEQAFTYLNDYREIIQMEDQEALNAILFDDWGELDFRWNWQIAWKPFRLGHQQAPPVRESVQKSLVHFTTAEKPWLPGCEYPERQYFFEYLKHTHWAGWTVPRSKEVLAQCRNLVGNARRLLYSRA